MPRARRLAIDLAAAALIATAAAGATPARADVTVIYAPAAASVPLVARPVCPIPGAEPAAVVAPPPEPAPRTPPPPIDPAPVAPPPIDPAPVAPPPIDPAPLAAPPTTPHAAPPPPPAAASSHATVPPAAIEPTPVAALAPTPCPTAVVLVRATDGRGERASLPLLGCDGAPDPESLVALSVLARPRTLATPPSARELAEHATHPELVAPGVRRLHPGLLERLRAIADRFPGHVIEIVSGYRPDARACSRHLHGLALDVRVVGASLDAVHAFVSRFDRTGVGRYPATGFLHVDVRERSTHWTDESAAGEAPRIVRAPDPPRAARSARARPATAPRDPDTVDARTIADEVLRGLTDIPLPPPPRRHDAPR